MPLTIGTEVVVQSLGRKRGVIVDASRDGRYRVRIDRVTVWCDESDLTLPDDGGKKRARKKAAPAPREQSSEPPARPGRVDLHGLSAADAIARLVEEIDRALQRGADRVEVVHGKGTGRVKDAVHRHVASMTVVKAFKLDPQHAGVTVVYF